MPAFAVGLLARQPLQMVLREAPIRYVFTKVRKLSGVKVKKGRVRTPPNSRFGCFYSCHFALFCDAPGRGSLKLTSSEVAPDVFSECQKKIVCEYEGDRCE